MPMAQRAIKVTKAESKSDTARYAGNKQPKENTVKHAMRFLIKCRKETRWHKADLFSFRKLNMADMSPAI